MRGDAHVRFGGRTRETGRLQGRNRALVRPYERAIVFSFDEKTQVQALDRTQPSLPMKRGRGGTMTHDYKRNGTTDLFAAMNVATGEVLYDCKKGHKATDVLRFFKLIDLHVPKELEIHVVLDNLSAHKSDPVKSWLADPKCARWHLQFTPTSSSWLNLVERWFKELTARRLRRGAFSSVPALVEAIEVWAKHWNDNLETVYLAQDGRMIIETGLPGTSIPPRDQLRDAPLSKVAKSPQMRLRRPPGRRDAEQPNCGRCNAILAASPPTASFSSAPSRPGRYQPGRYQPGRYQPRRYQIGAGGKCSSGLVEIPFS